MHLRIVTMTCTAAMILSAAALTPAFAQDGSSVMIRRDDSGGTRVTHLSMPNFEALRTPDFTRKDLPLFSSILVLSEPQSQAAGQRIDEYVKAFIALTQDLASVAGPAAEYQPTPEGEPAPGPGRGGMGPMGGPGVAFDDLESQLPPGSQVNVSMMMGINDDGDGGGGGAPPTPSAQVQVGIETPGGEDVDPALLEKFKERANEMAAKMMEQMAAQQEARANGEAPPRPGMGGGLIISTPEELEAQQAELKVKLEEFLKAKAKLRATFVADSQTDLAPEQVQRWPALERALTRERSLPKGRISGESTDLVTLLKDQKLPDSSIEALAQQVEAYEVDLDGALKRRDAFLADANKGIDQAMSSGDPDKAIDIAQKAADLRVAVRRVNLQYAELLALALAGGEGEQFRQSAMRAFYPRIYHETRGQKMFAAIDKMQGVPPDIAAAVADMRRSYATELAAMNDQIRQAIDREEPQERVRGLEQLKRTMNGENQGHGGEPALTIDEDPIRAMIDKRADLDDRYLKTVAALMPTEMAAGLPKPRTHKGPIIVKSGD